MKPVIESIHNPKIKLAIRLRDNRCRRRMGQIVIDGLREIEAARRAGLAFDTIFCTSSLLALESAEKFVQAWPQAVVQPVAERVFEKIAYGQRMSQAVAIAMAPGLELKNLLLPEQPLIVVLDQVEKPGNIGAVARTLSTAGADALVLTDAQCEVFNPNAIRASLGTVFSLPIASTTVLELQNWLIEAGIAAVRACVDGSISMWQADLRGPLAIILGSEAHGLSDHWNRSEWPAVQIPMRSGADSLNLSVSAALLCYESLRQRQAT